MAMVRYPLPMTPAMLATANAANEGKPRYIGAGATSDWAGGVKIGEDPGLPVAANEPFNTATVALANDGGQANEADYAPRS